MPLQLVVDDVGWWSGEDGSAYHEPYRTGIGRDHVPADYEALAALGRALGMRPLAAFVAAEWDRENLLRALPAATWMGARWDNGRWVGPWLEEAADILRRNRAHLELAVHSLAHERWQRGRMSRAAFHAEGGTMWPGDEIARHLELYGQVLDQHGLGPFPRAFVPPAEHHSFGDGETGMQAILRRLGVRFVAAHFPSCRQHAPPYSPWITSECGVTLVARSGFAVPWNALAPTPRFDFDQPTCALHWPNLLHADPARNGEVVDGWVALLRPFGQRLDGMLAADTRQAWTQTAYWALATVRPQAAGFDLDIGAVRPVVTSAFAPSFTVKIAAPPGLCWSLHGGQITAETFSAATNTAATYTAEIHDATGGHHILTLTPNAAAGRLALRGRPPSP